MRCGYLKTEYGQRHPMETGVRVQGSGGQITRGIDFELQRAAVITGRVYNSSGEGLAGAGVEALSLPRSLELYASTSEGLFRTTDGGTTWTSVSNGLPTAPVSSVIVLGDALLAGIGMRQDASPLVTAGDGVYRSTDDGRTWSASSDGLPPQTSIRALLAMGDAVLAAAGSPQELQ